MESIITTGIKGLDNILGSGIPKNTVTLLSGGPGTGKTLVSLNFLLEGAKQGERCCYLSFNESSEELIRASSNIEQLQKIKELVGKNLIIEYLRLNEKFDIDYLAKIFKDYPQLDRLVIDNVNKMLLFSETKIQYRKKLSEILNYLRTKTNCTLLLCETKKGEIDNGGEAFECDGVIELSFLGFEEQPIRNLEIHKMRYSSFAPHVSHILKINSKGIKLSTKKII